VDVPTAKLNIQLILYIPCTNCTDLLLTKEQQDIPAAASKTGKK
jgi:hypothetical protein